MNLRKKRRKFDAAAREAVAGLEQLRASLAEEIALIQETCALDLSQTVQADLTREFTKFAVDLRKSDFAAAVTEGLRVFRELRDTMIEASKSSAN
jgi:hypothetical protein